MWNVSLGVTAIMAALCMLSADSFVVGPTKSRVSVVRSMSIIDDLKLIFSEEGKKNRAAYDQRKREEAIEAQREILERRRDPKKMEQYKKDRAKTRKALDDERSVYDFQRKVEKGYDPLKDWTRLRKEGKIKIGKDLKRDESSRRFGSEGLNDVRIDERMPYIDQGYVDENVDVVGNFMKGLFGGKKDDSPKKK
mmetsp:Transcript_14818/g.34250  ORF Transcript_14818/g.34250 Transcript_14818/m.34250 type:complete len:194 (+) Transcript_14818:711-1292(+)|eukprot:CAMPEP_0116826658 /NCGR_PEP_ID=MMETSP0418-20121206/2652_1 /TAXON_ID=1158023 /ORGANISM="Astrosyne radiata, Strain 13vi08-1A" /LENGTH=193 /DNA_ID=CAMNT_0004455319 /DNA_START=637 /DNA_END=1218 /DNA_ORIENTATION=-